MRIVRLFFMPVRLVIAAYRGYLGTITTIRIDWTTGRINANHY